MNRTGQTPDEVPIMLIGHPNTVKHRICFITRLCKYSAVLFLPSIIPKNRKPWQAVRYFHFDYHNGGGQFWSKWPRVQKGKLRSSGKDPYRVFFIIIFSPARPLAWKSTAGLGAKYEEREWVSPSCRNAWQVIALRITWKTRNDNFGRQLRMERHLRYRQFLTGMLETMHYSPGFLVKNQPISALRIHP